MCKLRSCNQSFCYQKHRVTTFFSFFFFNDTATTEIYTLSLHDALPISSSSQLLDGPSGPRPETGATIQSRPALFPLPGRSEEHTSELRHLVISYAVFCLKKKKTIATTPESLISPPKALLCSLGSLELTM